MLLLLLLSWFDASCVFCKFAFFFISSSFCQHHSNVKMNLDQ